MPDDKPQEPGNPQDNPPNHDVPVVNGMTTDNAAAQTPVKLPDPKKAAPTKEGGKPDEEEPETPSRFMPQKTVADKVRDQLGVKTLDPHLEEMLKDAKSREIHDKDTKGMLVQLNNGSQLFVGQKGGKDVIGVPSGNEIDAAAAKTIVSLAKSKGLETVYATLTTEPEEKERLWLECQRQGIKMGNFEPKPDSDVVKQWHEEQKHTKGLTSADPSAPMRESVNAIKAAGEAATTDPALQAAYTQMSDKLRNGNLHVDEGVAKALTDAIAKGGRDGFNAAAEVLNKADPAFKIAALDPAPAQPAGQQPAVKLSRANP